MNQMNYICMWLFQSHKSIRQEVNTLLKYLACVDNSEQSNEEDSVFDPSQSGIGKEFHTFF